MMTNFLRIKNTCEDCPYLNVPAVDLSDADQYYTCRLTYANTYNLEHFQEICPLKTIQQVLMDFVCYKATNTNELLNFKKEKQLIKDFMREHL